LLLRCMSLLLALSDGLLRRRRSVAIGAIADIPPMPRVSRRDANDPNRSCGALFCCVARTDAPNLLYLSVILGLGVSPMRRREFITLLGAGAAAWPLAARAQQAAKVVRLGYLAPARLPNLIDALLAGLRDFGYVEGQNLAIEYRFALGQTKSY